MLWTVSSLRSHYVNTATGGTGPVAVDNAKLTAPAGASEISVLTTVAGEGGAVQPAGQTKVATGETVNVTFVPDEGYQLASVKVNGRKVEVADNTYALTMDQNYAVTADFEVIPDVPQVMFENDFESVSGDKFPFHGWTVKAQGYQQHMGSGIPTSTGRKRATTACTPISPTPGINPAHRMST